MTAKEKAELDPWREAHRPGTAGVPWPDRWHPHQLRHNAATEVRKEFGIEAARIILGHRSAAITEVYAENDEKAAMNVIDRVG